MVEIISPITPEDYNSIVSLLHEYHHWCCNRYSGERNWEFMDYFDETAWKYELASLKEIYAPPNGEFLLALQHSKPAGCVALNRHSDSVCELKRLFVHEYYRGQGIARDLIRTILKKAKEYGYEYVRLEFGELFYESKALYSSIGFTNIKAYTDIPDRLKPKMEFMEVKL